MAAILSYDDFRSKMKSGDLSQLYLFTGEESFLLEFCMAEVKKTIIDPSFEDFNYKCFIETPSLDDASSFITALPLMSQKKLIIFNSCSLFDKMLAEKSRWAELFLSLPDYVVVIVRENSKPDEEKKKKNNKEEKLSEVQTAITKAAQTVKFDYMPEARLKPWLVKFASSKGKRLSTSNASYMISSLGRSMTLLRSETEKIAAKAEEFEITKQDIDSVIIKPLTNDVFKLIDFVFSGRRDLSYDWLSSLKMSKQEPISILSLVASQVMTVYKAKLFLAQHRSTNDVKHALGGGYKADVAVSRASKVTVNKLEKMIHFLTNAEMEIKNGDLDPWCALELFIAL